MSDNYVRIQKEYLRKAWELDLEPLKAGLQATYRDGAFLFSAFGEDCALSRHSITLDGKEVTDPRGLLIALYASKASEEPLRLHPLKSFKELPGSMPYQGAFRANAELALVDRVERIQESRDKILSLFGGHSNADAPSGDFSFTLYPLAKIPLYYIFHLPDEDFPASVTCLFASNAEEFMPLDGLADVAEWTGKKLVSLCR